MSTRYPLGVHTAYRLDQIGQQPSATGEAYWTDSYASPDGSTDALWGAGKPGLIIVHEPPPGAAYAEIFFPADPVIDGAGLIAQAQEDATQVDVTTEEEIAEEGPCAGQAVATTYIGQRNPHFDPDAEEPEEGTPEHDDPNQPWERCIVEYAECH